MPDLAKCADILNKARAGSRPPNLVPLTASIPAEFLTPAEIYLKISHDEKKRSGSELSFLFESAATTEQIGRFSFVGAGPRKVLKTGPGHGPACDPMPALEKELSEYRVATVPGLKLPPNTGGAIGYVGYDCVRYFEPKTARDMKDVLNVPESFFMFYDMVIAFDHFFQSVQIITYLKTPGSYPSSADLSWLDLAHRKAETSVRRIVNVLRSDAPIPLPEQPPITPDQQYTSNIGRDGYEAHVTTLKKHICKGDIIQAVPSQRFSRPTSLHPFNIYRHLRTVNPSPYLFYLSCEDFSIVGASPELLVQKDAKTGRIITHPIAGTVKRGADAQEDEALASALRASLKDRAEHVMLVDLARNDVNRVCDPLSTRVDKLMVVQRFSHVQHLVSEVSGVLRPGQTRFDAFRSIFPAGTVSGAPKVKAMELIAALEQEKRGVYAGAVGYWGYNTTDAAGAREAEGAMDTCIALRTMLVKDGVAYLQAGGGIVFDSDPAEEWQETMNKLGANMKCIAGAEVVFQDEHKRGQAAPEAHIDIGG